MTLVATPVHPVATLADLLHLLGDVPPERIRAHPAPGQATEADALAVQQNSDLLCELVDGVLVEKATGFTESGLATILSTILNNYVIPRNLGLVTGADGTVRLLRGLIRIPDVAFVSWDRLPGRTWPTAPIPALAPDLAVEVLSESNTPAEMLRKRHDYFNTGVRLVWEVDSEARTVSVYTAATQGTVLNDTQTLDGGDVLPGFTLPLREFFGELDRHG
jgi:Uma2 family endonuclease